MVVSTKDAKSLPATSKENEACPFCSGYLRLRNVSPKHLPKQVYLECSEHPLHYRPATAEEIASMKG